MKIKSAISAIKNNLYDSFFEKIYGNNEREKEKQRERYSFALSAFANKFGKDLDISIYSIPGRVEISGNHTDHNNGLVMAASVTLDMIAVVCKNDSGVIHVLSAGFDEMFEVELEQLEPLEKELGTSCALIRGIVAGFAKENVEIGGFDAVVFSDVLSGSGLSSSAAFEVCIATILNEEYNAGQFTPVKLAQIGQFSENVYFGKPCGLMDQIACAVGGVIVIDFENAKAPKVEQQSLDLEKIGYRLVVTNTGGSHALLTDEYVSVRQEMLEVASYFGKHCLREISFDDLMKNIQPLRLALGDRAVLRSIHFFEECKRVKLLQKAIASLNFEEFKRNIIASGFSSFAYNQNVYSLQNYKEQGVSLALAISEIILAGKGAWRIQGGGFAGTIQAFVPIDILDQYCTALETVFGKGACSVIGVRNVGLCKII